MTGLERLLWLRVQRRAAALAPDLRAALLAAFRQLAESLDTDELAQLVRTGAVDRLVASILQEQALERHLQGFRDALRQGVDRSFRSTIRDLPRGAGRLVTFDVLNPAIVDGIRQLETRVMQQLAPGIREAVRAHVEVGLREGLNPRAIARDLRDIIGLAPNQAEAVRNFRRLLETGDVEALTRKLRDRRFDAVLRRLFAKGGRPDPAQVDTMADAYRRRMLAHNAETNARTAALDAQRLGQRLTWQRAVDAGHVGGSNLMRRYAGVLDDWERDAHLELEGETVPWNEPYSSGQKYAGEGDFNCRCIDFFFVAKDPTSALRAGAGARGIGPAALRAAARRARSIAAGIAAAVLVVLATGCGSTTEACTRLDTLATYADGRPALTVEVPCSGPRVTLDTIRTVP